MEVEDRELLEMAAKASGINLHAVLGSNGILGFHNYPSLLYWNPIIDDGDAFRLAVKLKLDISFFDGFGEVHAGGDGIISASCENYSEDMNASTRKAIVNAAAVIGRSMP